MFPAFWSLQSPPHLDPRPLISSLRLMCTSHKTSLFCNLPKHKLRTHHQWRRGGKKACFSSAEAARPYATWAQRVLPATHTRVPYPEHLTRDTLPSAGCCPPCTSRERRKPCTSEAQPPQPASPAAGSPTYTFIITGHLLLKHYAFTPRLC